MKRTRIQASNEVSKASEVSEPTREAEVITMTITRSADQFPDIPKSLKAHRAWIAYEKETKRPVSVVTTRSFHQFETELSDYMTAQGWVNHRRTGYGLGYYFDPSNHVVGIDLDNCLEPIPALALNPKPEPPISDPNPGDLKSWAVPILNRFRGAYVEVSPSKTGLHIILENVSYPLDSGRRRSYEDGKIEVYGNARYFTITGEQYMSRFEPCVDETGATWREYSTDYQAALEGFLSDLFPAPVSAPVSIPHPAPVQISNSFTQEAIAGDTIISAILEEPHYRALWNGELANYPSLSEGDQALCAYIARKGARTQCEIEAIFGQSPRSSLVHADGSQKWLDRADYRYRTISAVLTQSEGLRKAEVYVDVPYLSICDMTEDAFLCTFRVSDLLKEPSNLTFEAFLPKSRCKRGSTETSIRIPDWLVRRLKTQAQEASRDNGGDTE